MVIIVPKQKLYIIGRYSMRVMKMRQGQYRNCLPQIIDSFYFTSRILPNMFSFFASPRTRRPKPTSPEGRDIFVLTAR